jgi:hypothetical protein
LYGEVLARDSLAGDFFGLGVFFFKPVGGLMILELEGIEPDGVVEMEAFLAGACLGAGVFLIAGAFFGAAVFFTEAFLTGAALGAADFLAGAFLAGDFLTAAFLAGDFFTTRAIVGV